MSSMQKVIGLVVALALIVSGASLALAARDAGGPKPAVRTATAVAWADAARHMTRFRGTVMFRNGPHHWFMMRTIGTGRVRIYTYPCIRWMGCDWGDMGYGYHVNVRAYRNHGRWMAARMWNWRPWGHHGWGHGHWGPGGWMWGHGGMMGPGGMMW